MHRFGPGSGLKLTLASNKDEYNGALADAYGVRVSIHASGVDGHPDADGYIANVGETTQIAVRFVALERVISHDSLQFTKLAFLSSSINLANVFNFTLMLQHWMLKKNF